jgi:hypothetical protein
LGNQLEAASTHQEYGFYNNNYQPDRPHLISFREGFGWGHRYWGNCRSAIRSIIYTASSKAMPSKRAVVQKFYKSKQELHLAKQKLEQAKKQQSEQEQAEKEHADGDLEPPPAASGDREVLTEADFDFNVGAGFDMPITVAMDPAENPEDIPLLIKEEEVRSDTDGEGA